MESKRELPEVRIAMCKCREGGKTYGVRFEKRSTNWIYNWAFPIKEEVGTREKYEEDIKGMIEEDSEYPGCPYCRAEAFVICGSCGKLNCNMHGTNQNTFECNWCGFTGTLSNYDGDGIKSGNDR